MHHLNLGVLAHVDAGKTSLSERLLFEAGVIRQPGSVDEGTTQTDTLVLEQRRGITIKSAVVAFPLGDLIVNVIDTPGHPDFIAEVERALGVLDCAVLVVSGTDGVQPQTQLFMRVLTRLGIPTILFVNKLDRPNADMRRVCEGIRERLTPAALLMGGAERVGTPDVAFETCGLDDVTFRANVVALLADSDDEVLAAYVAGEDMSDDELRQRLVAGFGAASLHPVFGGSARTGAGVRALMQGLQDLCRADEVPGDLPATGEVFKIDRLASGERIAVVRMRSGSIRVRDHVSLDARRAGTVTAIEVAEVGGWRRRSEVRAGQIARIHGLRARIGDDIGTSHGTRTVAHLASPMLESVIRPRRRGDAAALSGALMQLGEQDPLIEVRQDAFGDLVVSLFGEVQKEVLASTILESYGLDVEFDQSRPVCVERPAAAGWAIERLEDLENPFSATIGIRIEPGAPDSGLDVRLRAAPQGIPLHIYKNRDSFLAAVAESVTAALEAGLYGWRVTDCLVTVTDCAYLVADGPRPPGKADTTARDFGVSRRSSCGRRSGRRGRSCASRWRGWTSSFPRGP